MIADKVTEITLHLLVDTFNLAIRLRVSCRTHTQLCALDTLEQFFPEGAGENAIRVRNNGQGHPMQFIHIVQKCFSNRNGREWMVKRDEMIKLGELVNHHKNAVIMTRSWEPLNEVHCHHIPG